MERSTRNSLFEEKEYMIRQTMSKHKVLLMACGLCAEDVYQELAVTLLEELDKYDPAKCANMDAYLMLRLKYRLLHLRDGSKLYGIPQAPRRGFSVVSLDALDISAQNMSANPAWIEREIDALPADQNDALNRLLAGKRISRRNKALVAARGRLRIVYGRRLAAAM